MLHPKLLHPQSIAVIGASDQIHTPGGKVLFNLISHGFKGELYGVNPKLTEVQGITCFQDVSQLPEVDMAIIAVAARFCVDIVRTLTQTKNTKAFIIFSAGFSEQDATGKALEHEIVALIDQVGGTLLGPNNIGMFNTHFAGVFTTPIPSLDAQGVDFISGSGATAVFIMEAAMGKGLTFNSVYSVGNSAQIGVEDILQHLDETYVHGSSAPIKLLYIESIQQPQKLFKHARSLREKGAKIAAIKAGSSEAGSRAASSHTGAIANADSAVDALFQKAGIIRCHGREELVHVAGILTYPELYGKRIGIITHAGGPAVMLTDVLSKNGLEVPKITHPKTEELLSQLYPGSSVSNPIDFLATGTAQQLDTILSYCDKEFDEIDAMVVIFGSPGLFGVAEVYEVLEAQMKSSRKPIYPILPSVINVKEEIETFVSHGNFAFFDEVSFGNALAKVAHTKTIETGVFHPKPDWQQALKKEIAGATGYLPPETINRLFQIMEIPIVPEQVLTHASDLDRIHITYPMVAKVIGPIHKTDVGGVRLNIADAAALQSHFESLMQLKDATGVLIQPMLSGMEIYVGAKKEGNFGHTIVCGLGGIMIEVMQDVSMGLTPLSKPEIEQMISRLKAYPMLQGIRGKKGIAIDQFAQVILKVSELVQYLPEIEELDINPLLANEVSIVAVDGRIRI
jgi:acyl-CoA synthetase (NDP forming)